VVLVLCVFVNFDSLDIPGAYGLKAFAVGMQYHCPPVIGPCDNFCLAAVELASVRVAKSGVCVRLGWDHFAVSVSASAIASVARFAMASNSSALRTANTCPMRILAPGSPLARVAGRTVA